MKPDWTADSAPSALPVSLDDRAWPSATGAFYHYAIYGITLRSQIQFSFEQASPLRKPDIDLRVAPPGFFRKATAGAILKQTPSGWYRYAEMPDRRSYLLWEGLFEFLIEADGRRVWCGWLGSTSLESLQVYLLGHALSFALVKQGFEPLHATAVVIEGEAVAFLGDSGFGKSTLAAAFLDAGHRLLTDDLLLSRPTAAGYDAFPGPPRVKLFPKVARRFLHSAASAVPMNEETEKLVLPVGADRHHRAAAPLRTIYVLAAPREVFRKQSIRLTRLSQREAFVELIRNTFNYLITDSARLQRQYAESLALVSRVPVKRISYPRVLATLPEVRDTIVADLASESPSATVDC
ncbi:MAG: hypothetical protein Q7S58_08690 [Candidatus Binatus sp.]|uniref:hypothetical protein n=1 Tax=Candidatus Binatus sp. TaxID=2811406 RepID=UPI00271A9650|nr:hypothetical protein [Candidatus Binatus sp.]MDO8432470.1 hypothetical protein [Candidatus Binatus sp.]